MMSKKNASEAPIWLLVYTKPREEQKANENLKKQGFETFLPQIISSNVESEDKPLVPVFPRYIFAKINLHLENWTLINSTFGVSKIVMFSDKLTPIPEHIIDLMKSKLSKPSVYKEYTEEVDYKEGEEVTIKEGRFAGLDAIFLSRKSKDRVRLLLQFLSTTVVAEIDNSQMSSKKIVKTFKF